SAWNGGGVCGSIVVGPRWVSGTSLESAGTAGPYMRRIVTAMRLADWVTSADPPSAALQRGSHTWDLRAGSERALAVRPCPAAMSFQCPDDPKANMMGDL